MNSTRIGRASPMKARVVPREPPREIGFAEQTTLFLIAFKKPNASELLEGLAEMHRHTARLVAQRVSEVDSPTRQARLALEFGTRDDARSRIDALLSTAPIALRAAIEQQLPAAWRRAERPTTLPSPALSMLAARLVREATR